MFIMLVSSKWNITISKTHVIDKKAKWLLISRYDINQIFYSILYLILPSWRYLPECAFWPFGSLLIFLHVIWRPRRHKNVLSTFNLGGMPTGIYELFSCSCWPIIVNSNQVHRSSIQFLIAYCECFMSILSFILWVFSGKK